MLSLAVSVGVEGEVFDGRTDRPATSLPGMNPPIGDAGRRLGGLAEDTTSLESSCPADGTEAFPAEAKSGFVVCKPEAASDPACSAAEIKSSSA